MLQPPKSDWSRHIYPASRLDEYLAYRSGVMLDGSEYTTREFIRRMTTYEETPQMAAGTAVHEVIEHAGFGTLPERCEARGWTVLFDLDGELRLPRLREAALYRRHKHITLVGRTDALDAVSVHDIKTTGSAIDADRYLDSYQWRSYLWMSGCRLFVYDVLKVKLDEEAKSVTVQEYVRIPITAYPGMDCDVETVLEEFDATVHALGIPAMMQRRAA